MALRSWGFVLLAGLAATVVSGCGGCGSDPMGDVDGSLPRPDAKAAKADGSEVCIPTTCQALQANCGSLDDGCGTKLDCGSCDAGICGGGGTPNQCGWTLPDTGLQPPDAELVEPPDAGGEPPDAGPGADAAAPVADGGGVPDTGPLCVPQTNCAAMGFSCGAMADGCGGVTDCGTCSTSGVCGGVEPNVCFTPALCVRKGCADYPAKTCGKVSDGCGGLTQDCGGCTAPETCGGGGVASQCGALHVCVPKTCDDFPDDACGVQSDGCGGLTADCGSCTWPQTCGGGGVASVCGGGPPPCDPKTCADFPAGTCGRVADGCGGLTDDCGACTKPGDSCGGGGIASLCGGGVPPCVPKTCADFPAEACGRLSDGCGGLTAVCGTCPSTQTCGGGGVPSTCFGPLPCTPKTCADFPANTCGRVPDGCGGLTADCGGCTLADCPTCQPGDTCGGGGVPSVCGGAPPPCTRKTCADYPANACGQLSDGCGGLTADCGGCTLADCPTCQAGDTCGGGGVPSQCGGGGGTACINLECKQVVCSGTATTSISGTVYDPAGVNPLYNVFVYVPNGTPAAFPSTVSCDKCADALSGYPLVTTLTNEAGHFKLDNMPVGTNIPVVIQTGKWRRQFTVSTAACVDTPVAATFTRFPRTKAEGDIPRFAVSTGSQDYLECMLRKIGIADSEFTAPSGNGRVHLYTGFCDWLYAYWYTGTYDCTKLAQNFCPKQDRNTVCETAAGPYFGKCVAKYKTCGDTTISYTGYSATLPRAKDALWNTVANLSKYDAVLLACEGGYGGIFSAEKAPYYKNIFDYTGLGGRVFLSHYHLEWVKDGPSPWPSLATWNLSYDLYNTTNPPNPVNATVLTGFPKGVALKQWLLNVGASTTGGILPIYQGQHSIDAVDASRVTNWVTAYNAPDVGDPYANPVVPPAIVPSAVQYLSFNTPVGAAADQQCGRVVVTDIHMNTNKNAEDDSSGTAFPARCGTDTTMTAQQKALEFMIFDLGSRVCDDRLPPEPPVCIPRTCADQGIQCGSAPDGCGGTIASCGTCQSPLVCSTGGKCGGSTCTATTCAALGLSCGSAPDGCGGVLDCGTCQAPQTCGGSGIPGVCGGGTCTKTTCAALDLQCGLASDGCGGTLDCDTCPSPYTCGGSGIVGRCGGAVCTPTTCEALGMNCGQASDGCGGTLTCPVCQAPQTCGGGGIVGRCGGNGCTPTTCAALLVACGDVADGCGGTLHCGDCAAPDTCGGGGILGRCGGGCTPATCESLGYTCGFWSDGCGGTLECGTCQSPKRCGGGGVLGACGGGCLVAGDVCSTVPCGPAADGCGGVVNCGPCSLPDGGLPTCVPLACSGRCGLQGDGCGGTITCPACPASGCVATTCEAYGAQCGRLPDGCGGVLECGGCDAGTCGAGGQPLRCP